MGQGERAVAGEGVAGKADPESSHHGPHPSPSAPQAWDLYYHVFKRINKQLHSLTTLELQYVAPALVRAQGMELAVPGGCRTVL